MSPAKTQGGNSTDQAAASLSVMALKRDPIAFPKLDDEQVSALAKFATLKSFAQGETLFAAGELDFKFFVVKSGQVAIVDRSAGKDEIVTIDYPVARAG